MEDMISVQCYIAHLKCYIAHLKRHMWIGEYTKNGIQREHTISVLEFI